MIYSLSLAAFVAMLGANSVNAEQQLADHLVAYVPVLSTCESEVKNDVAKFGEFTDRLGVSAEYKTFSEPLLTHPEISGFVEVRRTDLAPERSQHLSVDLVTNPNKFLVGVAGGLNGGCFANTSVEFQKSNPSDAEEMFKLLNMVAEGSLKYREPDGREGYPDPHRIYIVNEPDVLRVWLFVDWDE